MEISKIHSAQRLCDADTCKRSKALQREGAAMPEEVHAERGERAPCNSAGSALSVLGSYQSYTFQCGHLQRDPPSA
jgi:hypothetical protein